MSQWQPIETAPRDGTEILVCFDNGTTWEFGIVLWSGHEFPWEDNYNSYLADHFDLWQPLPAAPARVTA